MAFASLKVGARPSDVLRTGTHQFVRASDGVELSVRTWNADAAKNRPWLILNDGLGCDGYVWRPVVERFGDRFPIVHWHYRGHGFSEVPPDLESVHIDQAVDDLARILRAVGVDDGVFLGHSMGVQVVLEAFRSMRQHASGLVLMCGSSEYPLESWHGAPDKNAPPPFGNRAMKRAFPKVSALVERAPRVPQALWSRLLPTRLSYEIATRFEVDGTRLTPDDFFPYLEHVAHMHVGVFARFAKSLSTHSARDLLPEIEVPTLVVGAGRDTFTPGWRSEEMHELIPESDFLYLPEGTHTAPLEWADDVGRSLESFFERVDGARRAAR